MANVKLTLSIPEHFVGKAKSYVSRKHTSLSKMFYELMSRELESNENGFTEEGVEKAGRFPLTPEIKTLTGVIKSNYSDKELDDMKYEYLSEKYGLK